MASSSASIRAAERNAGLQALTFEELTQRRIDQYKGSPDLPRPGILARLDKQEADLKGLMADLQKEAEDPDFLSNTPDAEEEADDES